MIICSEDVTKELQIMLGTSEPLCPFSIEVRCIEGDLRVFVWSRKVQLATSIPLQDLGCNPSAAIFKTIADLVEDLPFEPSAVLRFPAM